MRGVKVEIAGELADAPPRYVAVLMTVSGQCEPPDLLQKLVNTLGTAAELTIA